MTLPKINHPVFKITIPSTKKTLSFRPYTVKEEKLLLMVKSSDDYNDIADTLKQVILNCCVEPIEIEKLAMFDVEYIFVKLRAKSVGETIELNYTKNNQTTDFEVNLEKVEVKFNLEHKRKFMLTGNIGVNMNYPSITQILQMERIIADEGDVDQYMFDMFVNCIENVFDDNTIYKDFTKQEIDQFILDLPRDAIQNIKQFFETIPVLEHKMIIKLKDGTEEEITLRGLKDFFIF